MELSVGCDDAVPVVVNSKEGIADPVELPVGCEEADTKELPVA
jgi:hypothetical protein